MTSPAPAPAAVRFDLRQTVVDDVLDRVQKALHLHLDPDGSVRKRRSIGMRSDRGTWVRVECRGLERLDGQGWGLEAAMVLPDAIPRPKWFCGISWADPVRQVLWRADETALAAGTPIGRATHATQLNDSWWRRLHSTLDALDGCRTARQATPDCEPISTRRIATDIAARFPGIDATVPGDQWTTAHADFTWQNLTGPTLSVLDWEDFGTAPRGLDAATLWFASLTQPGLAERIRTTRGELGTRTGQLMMLWRCAQFLTWAGPDEPVYDA
ncbi:MAG: hypothetical protein AUG49_20365, partial [Catenulispora sp. 13_1_20CM_3_70_7]